MPRQAPNITPMVEDNMLVHTLVERCVHRDNETDNTRIQEARDKLLARIEKLRPADRQLEYAHAAVNDIIHFGEIMAMRRARNPGNLTPILIESVMIDHNRDGLQYLMSQLRVGKYVRTTFPNGHYTGVRSFA